MRKNIQESHAFLGGNTIKGKEMPKKIFILLTTILLAACGGGSSANSPSSTPDASVGASFTQARAAAEASGAIPMLDRTASLLGTDANGNGVRDDIDAYINSLPYSSTQKAALTQQAAALTATLTVDTTNSTAVANVDKLMMNAASCNQLRLGEEAADRVEEIQKFTMNTGERFTAYMRFAKALSGTTATFPAKGVGCAQ